MSAALPIAEVILAAVFAAAGGAKLFDLAGSRRAVAAFGVPRRLAAPLGTLLPFGELATAALLVVGAAAGGGRGGLAGVGAVSALALLAAFCIAIAVSLLRGRTPDCHCFGGLHSAPAGPGTLARNVALLAVAVFVVAEGGPVASVAGGLAALALVAVLLGGRARGGAAAAQGPPAGHARNGALPLGSPAPGFELPALDGSPHTLAGLLGAGRPALLVFSDPDCGPCIALAPELAAWQREHAGEITIAVIERAGERPAAADPHARHHVLLQRDREIADLYRAHGTPSALLVAVDGTVASELAPGAPAIRELMTRTIPGFDARGAAAPAEESAGSFLRRELIARAAAASAALPALFSLPAWASSGQLEAKCRYERCEGRCCPKKAKCRPHGKKGDKVCICPDGRPACGKRCCRETFVCRRVGGRRRCVCPAGYEICSGRCVRTRTDPNHCGRCGRDCPTGTTCVDGACVGGDGTGTGPGGSGDCECPPGKSCCEGECTDLNSEELHCGECGKQCPAGQTCCEGQCKDLESDHKNCGRCGRRCEDNEVCSQGECRRRCNNGLTNCNGSCVNTDNDPEHCGRCAPCNGPFDTGECCGGECCDINGSTCCSGKCKNLSLDSENCGECGNVCMPGGYCRFGTCVDPMRTGWRRRLRAGRPRT